MKMFKWISEHLLSAATLFLLAFIPLYPKLPLLDVKNTWVYVRAEDFVVIFVLLILSFLFFRRKITLKTPLTLPIIMFWVVGGIATIHAMLLIFPTVSNVFPNVAFLSFLRRVEYLSLFFVGFEAVKDKKFLKYIVAVLMLTLFCVAVYGIGQKYLEFPAYLTMNEEFAKGAPITLSRLSRVPSTFGGHYDLAAYLVLIIPILLSLVFGVRNIFVKALLLGVVSLGFVVMFMTVSRVSFFVLLISLIGLLFFQKKKLIVFLMPVVIIFIVFSLTFSTTLLDRFGNTIKEVDVLVDANTGEAIGHVNEIESKNFENKLIIRKYVRAKDELIAAIRKDVEDPLVASSSAIFPFSQLPLKVLTLTSRDVSTGENLPQGTGYINLLLSPVTQRPGEIFYEKPTTSEASKSAEVLMIHGNFLIKRAAAYDLSFTTRFQGEWPKAIEAFKKNVFLGSGFSSVSLAVDNNYLRLLGEIGLLGFVSFLTIFLIIAIYIKRILPNVDSPIVRSFVLGFAAGVVGLAFNAIFIDVFEASKVAFMLWLLAGITLGTLHLYEKKSINLYRDLKNLATSNFAIIFYLFIAVVALFSPFLGNFFTGDDFTWLRWVTNCESCSILEKISAYFLDSNGFFYRPGTKVYFLIAHSLFWLNQTVFHVISLLLHFIVAVLVFFLFKKVLGDLRLSVLASFLFVVLSSFSEAIFWISSTGFLFNAMFTLLSLIFFIRWEEKRKKIYIIATVISITLSLLFHEVGVIAPILILLYKFTIINSLSLVGMFRKAHLMLFVPLLLYLPLRLFAQSHWFSGDYSYNLVKLPFNLIGNMIGYIFLTLFGAISLPLYQAARNFSRENIIIFLILSFVILSVIGFIVLVTRNAFDKKDRQIIIFGSLFFVISLLPFLGLGNITSRYGYLASIGLILLFVLLLKKLYVYLLWSGKEVAISGLVFILTLFSLLHIMQIQQIHGDWYEAGLQVRKFFVAIDAAYTEPWSKTPTDLYFVNVPIRTGEAWIFPVGLSDAVWFAFESKQIRTNTPSSLESALDYKANSKNAHVFRFNGNGGLEELARGKNKEVIIINKK